MSVPMIKAMMPASESSFPREQTWNERTSLKDWRSRLNCMNRAKAVLNADRGVEEGGIIINQRHTYCGSDPFLNFEEGLGFEIELIYNSEPLIYTSVAI